MKNATRHEASTTADWCWSAVWLDERGGGWRVAATLALVAAGVISGLAIQQWANTLGLKRAIAGQPGHVQEVVRFAATFVITTLGLFGCLLGVRYVHRKPIARVFTDGRSFATALAIQSATLWALLWCAFTLPLPGVWQGIVRRSHEVPLPWWPIVAVSSLAAMTVGRTSEQVLFRGYLLTRVAAWVKRPWLAIGILATLFTAVHKGNPAAHTAIALFGVAWGLACVRAGTLAPMIGMHAVHDTLNTLLTPEPTTGEGNANTTWLEVVLIALALAVWFVWLLWVTRKSAALPRPTCA